MAARTRRARRFITLASIIAGIAIGACTDIPTAPDHPFSIDFDGLPFPAVVVGDSLRAPDGTATPLSARVYNVNGDLIEDAELSFIASGAGVTVLEGGYVVGDSIVGADGGVSIYARAAGLQSLPARLFVTMAPDSLDPRTETVQELEYSVLPEPDLSPALRVRLLRDDEQEPGGVKGVAHWPVAYSLVVRGDTVAPGDSSVAWLVQESSLVPATADTTSTSGDAALRVRLNPYNTAGITGLDSVEVLVSAGHRGSPLRGSPIRFVVQLRQAP